jgi:tRNA-binding protein
VIFSFEIVSNKLKSGAFVPNANIFDGVRDIIFINLYSKIKHLMAKDTISFEDFQKIDIRIGTIIEINDFPKAKIPAYQLKIDFGKLGIKESSAQITSLYTKKELLNKEVVAIINFKPKQIADFMSECLVLGVQNGKDVVLLQSQKKARNGSRIT